VEFEVTGAGVLLCKGQTGIRLVAGADPLQ
jgi:hypothetical protein